MKPSRTSVLVVGAVTAVLWTLCAAVNLPGQGGGSRAGVYTPQAGVPTPASTAPEHKSIKSYITIVGKAEIRVKPSAIRVIMAVTSQGATAEECMKTNGEKETAFTQALAKLGVPEDKIFMDFISMLPVYDWQVEERQGTRCFVEDVSGYMVQTNAHVEVSNEAQARDAVRAAFQLGITDIISFDYWCDSLDERKIEAQKKALAEAQRKAELLLTAHFQNVPAPLNLDEHTEVVYPKSLYESFTNDYTQSLRRNYHRQSLPEVHAIRPKNTHYRGFFAETDSQDPRLPMQPEISVVSTISCYYATPTQGNQVAAEKQVKETKRRG